MKAIVMNWRATFLSFVRDVFRYTLQRDGRIVVAGIKDTGYPGLGIHSFAVTRYIGDSIVKVTFQTSPVSGGSISFNGTTYTNGQNGNYTVTSYGISASPPAGYSSVAGAQPRSHRLRSNRQSHNGDGQRSWLSYCPLR